MVGYRDHTGQVEESGCEGMSEVVLWYDIYRTDPATGERYSARIERIEYDPKRDVTRITWRDGRVEIHNGRLYAAGVPVYAVPWIAPVAAPLAL